jgi:hypothetical protein
MGASPASGYGGRVGGVAIGQGFGFGAGVAGAGVGVVGISEGRLTTGVGWALGTLAGVSAGVAGPCGTSVAAG